MTPQPVRHWDRAPSPQQQNLKIYIKPSITSTFVATITGVQLYGNTSAVNLTHLLITLSDSGSDSVNLGGAKCEEYSLESSVRMLPVRLQVDGQQ